MEVGNCTMWSELLDELLESIFKRVGVIEYFMCACVCKSWRSVANDFKQKFMASQGPLVFLMPKHISNHCYFYNMFEKRLYRAALPHLAWSNCYGFTCGYLVFLGMDRAKLWLVNPFTRHELEFPGPPNMFCDVILASLANADQEYLVVAFSRVYPFLQFRRSGDVKWTVLTYFEQPWRIVDVAVFKGKIYFLSSYGEICTLNLNSAPMVKMLDVTSVGACLWGLHLVASDEELYVAHFHPAVYYIEIYKLDFERMEWVRVRLRGELLFLGLMKCCGLTFPTPSCSRSWYNNQVWGVGFDPSGDITGYHTAQYVSDSSIREMSAIPEDWEPPKIYFRLPIWYFPHLSSSVDSVYEN